MATTKRHKRKPFGTSAANVLNSKKRPSHTRHSKSDRASSPHLCDKQTSRNPGKKHPGKRGSETTENIGRTQGTRLDAREDAIPDAEKRRDSKTPKTNNTSAIMGACSSKNGLNLREAREKPKSTKRATKCRPIAKLDPSPIQRPDPLSSKASASEAKRPSNPTRSKGKISRDKFVSALSKRLFPSKRSTQGHLSLKKNTESNNPIDGMSPPGRHYASSDMDTAGSTPEKDSPLITSPFTKLDPVAEGEGIASDPVAVDVDSGLLAREENTRKHVDLKTTSAGNQPVHFVFWIVPHVKSQCCLFFYISHKM